jgi:bifunctional ADP-heptose synthase (sugar kinase/adenylyltransferase)
MSESHVTEKSDFAGLMEALTSAVAEIAGLDVADYAPGVIEHIYRDTISLVEQNSDLAVDPHSERLLKFASSILAAYRNFEAVVAEVDVRLELMKKAVCGYFEPDIKNYIKIRFDIEYQKPEEAFDMATKNFISKGLGAGAERGFLQHPV